MTSDQVTAIYAPDNMNPEGFDKHVTDHLGDSDTRVFRQYLFHIILTLLGVIIMCLCTQPSQSQGSLWDVCSYCVFVIVTIH